MRLAYRIVNVFARRGERLSGNPLCVFEDGRGLSDADMQALALQFNLSETSFILPPSATGSACANLGGYVLATNAPLPFKRVVHQGQSAGRPSILALEVDAARAIRVSGEVIELGRGVIELW